MNNRRWTIATLVIAGLVATAAPLLAGAFDNVPLSKDLSYGTYGERVGRVELVVGAYLAALDEKDEYIPFQIAVGAWGKGPELRITIENFELHDSEGNVYQAATPKQVGETGLNQMVRNWRKTEPLQVGNLFDNSHAVVSDFYPEVGITTGEVHLDRETFFTDVIFFPRPGPGLEGEMMLSLYAHGMKEGAVNVRFKAPEMKKKTTKKKKKG